MDKLSQYKGLIALVALIAGGILWFTPMSYAKKTREMVVMMSDTQQLKWMQTEKREWEINCTDKMTDEWICSESKRISYEGLNLDIELLRNKLGLPLLKEDQP